MPSGCSMCAIAPWRAVEDKGALSIALHEDEAGLIASHLATHPELTAEGRKRWGKLAGAIGRTLGRFWRVCRPAQAREAATTRT